MKAALPAAIFGLALVAAAPASAQVQATLRGVVRSSVTGEPLAGAVVQIVGTRVVAQTDDQGRYELLSVPAGVSVVRVTHPGHAGTVERLEVGQPAALVRDFELLAPAFVLRELVARAVRARTPVPGHTIEGDRLNGNRSVREVLDGVTGVTLVRTGGAVGTGYHLRVRGAKSFSFDRHPVVFVDGVRVHGLGTDGGMGALELIATGTVARIEVIKGPSADAKYGPDAADGVVLITTKRGSTRSKP